MRLKALIKVLKSLTGTAAVPDADGMSASFGGSALAIGDNTLTTGHVAGRMVDKGDYAVAKGEATFLGAAQSGPGAPLAAAATTFVDVDSADFVFTRTRIKSVSGEDGVSVRTSTKFFAIDFDGWAPDSGPIVVEMNSFRAIASNMQSFAGNLATVDAAAHARGDNTLSATLTVSLVVDQQLSAVDGMATMAIG